MLAEAAIKNVWLSIGLTPKGHGNVIRGDNDQEGDSRRKKDRRTESENPIPDLQPRA